MLKLFISGTGKMIDLPDRVKKILVDIEYDTEILIGDCYGVDYLVQSFIAGYRPDLKVTVYASGNKHRNVMSDEFAVKYIPVPDNITGRAFYTEKDKAMITDCDIAFAVWDGKSAGTGNNIRMLKSLGKPVYIYHTGLDKLLRSK